MTTLSAIEIIARRVGMSDASYDEVMDLAVRVGMDDLVRRRPRAVAAEIERYLDDLVKNP